LAEVKALIDAEAMEEKVTLTAEGERTSTAAGERRWTPAPCAPDGPGGQARTIPRKRQDALSALP